MSPAATSDSLSGISLSTAASAEYGRANLLVLEGRRAADGVWLLGNTALLVDVILSPTASAPNSLISQSGSLRLPI
jgi:hypothetical protein